jgi:hypothetical protein
VFDDKIQSVQLGTIAENKRLGAALALVKEQPTTWPATSAPRAATATEQSGRTGNADEEPAVALRGRRGVGRTARFLPLYSVT